MFSESNYCRQWGNQTFKSFKYDICRMHAIDDGYRTSRKYPSEWSASLSSLNLVQSVGSWGSPQSHTIQATCVPHLGIPIGQRSRARGGYWKHSLSYHRPVSICTACGHAWQREQETELHWILLRSSRNKNMGWVHHALIFIVPNIEKETYQPNSSS